MIALLRQWHRELRFARKLGHPWHPVRALRMARYQLASNELAQLEPENLGVLVCVTHRRFLPCRTEEGCVFSADENDVRAVRLHQQGK